MTGKPDLVNRLVRLHSTRVAMPEAILRTAVEAYAEQEMPVGLCGMTASSAPYETAITLMRLIHVECPNIPVASGGSHVSTWPDLFEASGSQPRAQLNRGAGSIIGTTPA